MTGPLRTEADLLRTLERGCYTMPELYRLAEDAGLANRPGARTIIQDGQAQYKRRVRSALQSLKRQGRARPTGERAAWLIEGCTVRPRRALLVWLPRDPSQVELVLGAATDVLAHADEPIDLIVADPPWALGRADQRSAYRRTYGRNHGQVVPGYIDVDPAEYADFTAGWIAAAGEALRPGGCLAIVTGAQQAARVQVIAEDLAGLTYVNSIAVPRAFGLYATRRYVHQHHRVTLMTRGPLDSPHRIFRRPDEMPRGRAGQVYAVDVWTDVPEERRRGLLRYDNALAPALVSRLIRSTTHEHQLVADPFLKTHTFESRCASYRLLPTGSAERRRGVLALQTMPHLRMALSRIRIDGPSRQPQTRERHSTLARTLTCGRALYAQPPAGRNA